jgi:phosphatidylinositol alpha-1,6-mannosyltransferase
MRNPKILFLSLYTFSLTGGIEKVCRIFNQVLASLQLNAKNYSLHDKPLNKDNYKAFAGNKINFSYHVLKEGLKSDVIILSHINLLLFAQIIKKINPRKRIILFAHGIEIWNELPNWKRAFLKEIEIWAVSNFTKKQIVEKHYIPTKNIKVLNNCIDSDFEFPIEKTKPITLLQKYNLSTYNKIILTVCRLSSAEQYKGYDMVLLALKDLIKSQPNLKYFIVGKADELEKRRIESLINQYGLQETVILAGYVANQELQNFYKLADVFAMPSKGEGFGIVFLEALANGCKVLAGNADGSTDALLNGKLGTLVDPENVEEIYQNLIKLLSEPFSGDIFKENQNVLKENFGFEVYVKNVNYLLVNAI